VRNPFNRDWLLVFLVALLALFLLRGEALRTPYFWDEVGYYVPAAVSMYRNNLYPIPETTVPQSYPPLQPLTIVAGWWLFGLSIVATRIVGFLGAAAAVAVTYLLGREVASREVGLAAAALTLASPVFFGQTGFAQPEVLLALFTVWATLELVRGRMRLHAVAIACLLMTKWTAIISLPAFGLYALVTARTWREGVLRQLWYLPGLAILAAWLGFFYSKTGTLTSTDARYARVNLWDNLAVDAFLFRMPIRFEQLFENDLAWLLYGPILVAAIVWLPMRAERGTTASAYLLMAAQCAAYLAFLTISGFLLPRYFVPVWPFVAVMGAAALFSLLPRPAATAYVAGAALLMHLCWYGWFPGFHPALLDARTEYMRLIDTHVAAARYIEERYPGARVATTWPIVDDLRHPYLGYVTTPVETIPVDALPEGERALEAFDVLFEAPIPQNPNPARDLALRLGLVEVATFASGDQRATLWVAP
jgi:4-amino-4-deoxy-L-arabinose transferase-like glycosyltransferase